MAASIAISVGVSFVTAEAGPDAVLASNKDIEVIAEHNRYLAEYSGRGFRHHPHGFKWIHERWIRSFCWYRNQPDGDH